MCVHRSKIDPAAKTFEELLKSAAIPVRNEVIGVEDGLSNPVVCSTPNEGEFMEIETPEFQIYGRTRGHSQVMP